MVGTTRELIEPAGEAHRRGLRVLLDLVHGHAATNEGEGLCRFDGTVQAGYFKDKLHPEWQT